MAGVALRRGGGNYSHPLPMGVSDQGLPSMAGLFTLGEIVIKPQAERLLTMQGINPASLLLRHVIGDWGDASQEQQRTNDEALREGGRILSVYGTGRRQLFVMTEADRRTTTIMALHEDD